MTRALASVRADTSDDVMLEILHRDGAVILEDLLAPDVLTAFNAEIDAIFAAEAGVERKFVNDTIAGFFSDKVAHVAGLAGKSTLFVEHVLCHPRFLSICDRVLLPNCADYQLNIAHVMERLPGCDAQFVHRDGWVWKRLPREMGEVQLASVIALMDFTADSGATLVVPGSHRWEEGRYPKPEEAIAAEMKAGSAVVYLGQTFHAGGANVTPDVRRRGMHVSYCVGWLRTEENNSLSTPVHRARQMSTRAQQLLGFGIHDDLAAGGGYLGTHELTAPYALWK